MLHLALGYVTSVTVCVSVCVPFVGMKGVHVSPSGAHTQGHVRVNSLNTGTNWHQFLSVKATKGDDTPSTPLRLKLHRTQRSETHPVFLAAIKSSVTRDDKYSSEPKRKKKKKSNTVANGLGREFCITCGLK